MTKDLQRQTPIASDERQIVDRITEHVGAYRREVVANYYVALKTGCFVVLVGPDRQNQTRLAQGLADSLVGRSSLQLCAFQAHPWWANSTGNPGQFATSHAQFNALKLLDFIDVASASEAAGFPYLFFSTIKRMSAAELECYFHDLPQGLFWQADTSVISIDLPRNVYATGILETEPSGPALDKAIYRHATVIPLPPGRLPRSAARRNPSPERVDWQRAFSQSAVQSSKQARAKLARILPDGQSSPAPIADLDHVLWSVPLPPFARDQVWRYLANAFDRDGNGLFVATVDENLRIAQDHALAQYVLPHLDDQLSKRQPGALKRVTEYLANRFPRAHAQAIGRREVSLDPAKWRA
ncbi:MAG TPA: hypothetical protein ENN19_17530 [Chloroflexi bacterium]|nr:hypothetical protein [Chloroflexota bacterium]